MPPTHPRRGGTGREQPRAGGRRGPRAGNRHVRAFGIGGAGPVDCGASSDLLGQTELAGRSYSATLVAAVARLAGRGRISPRELGAIVAVHGPGSFTGVRVGLSAVKGLAEPGGIPVAVVSRLAVLAHKAGVLSAALDAHRHEVFLRRGSGRRETARDAGGKDRLCDGHASSPSEIAVCDDAAEELIRAVWPEGGDPNGLRLQAPPDAMECSRRNCSASEFVDLALLDGHYLRRSDAEIFGEPLTDVLGAARMRDGAESTRAIRAMMSF